MVRAALPALPVVKEVSLAVQPAPLQVVTTRTVSL